MRSCAADLAQALADATAGRAAVEIVTEPWHCGLFSGERHAATLRYEGSESKAEASTLLARLIEHEFALDGFLVADVAATRRGPGQPGAGILLEILTIREE